MGNKDRNETRTQRLDRNWLQLLQELRVLQTGVQLLTGFLLILPFQSGFSILNSFMQNVYLVTVLAAVGATILAVAPVAWHRFLFRTGSMDRVVGTAHICSMAALVLVGTALTGVTMLVVDATLGFTQGIIAGLVSASAFLIMWIIIPLLTRRKNDV